MNMPPIVYKWNQKHTGFYKSISRFKKKYLKSRTRGMWSGQDQFI
jgi:hypothetical protein